LSTNGLHLIFRKPSSFCSKPSDCWRWVQD